MTLQELLQARAAKHDGMKALLNKAEAENRELTEEEDAQFNALDAEFENLTSQIAEKQAAEDRKRKITDRENELNEPQRPAFRPSAVSGSPVQAKKLDTGGFANLGEFLNAVRFGDAKGRLEALPTNQKEGQGFQMPEAFVASVMPHRSNEWQMGVGEDGGFAVPEQHDTSRVWRLDGMPNIVRSRATVIPPGSPPDASLTFPALNQGENGYLGGVEVTWIGEGEDKPETDAKLLEVTLTPNEVAATTVVTDKLLRNWSAGATFIQGLLRAAMAQAEDVAFMSGNGVAKPTGVLGAAAVIPVNRDSANTVTYIDVLTMIARLHGSGVWVANKNLLPVIATMTDAQGNIIFGTGNMALGLPATLLGIPIVFTDRSPAVGAKGDLALIDFSQYLIKDGSGPFVAASEHVLFRQNKTVIKCFWNTDGKPWVPAKLKLLDGSYVSPYVVLDVPKAP